MAGIAANTFAFAALTISDALAKLALAIAPLAQTLSIRGGFLLLLLSPLLLRASRRGEPVFATRHPGLHLARFAFQATSVLTFFFAVRQLDFTMIIAIMLATPIFAALAGVAMLGERIRAHQMAAIAIGLVGCLITVNPQGGAPFFWTMVALFSSITWGVSLTFLRLLARTESHASILAWSNCLFIGMVTAVAPFDWRPIEGWLVAMIFVMAATQFVGQWFSTLAYRMARVATVAPAQYSQMLWATLLGVLFWREWPATNVWIGVALVMVGGVWLIRAEGAKSRKVEAALSTDAATEQKPLRPLENQSD